jgi:hypothetical protein
MFSGTNLILDVAGPGLGCPEGLQYAGFPFGSPTVIALRCAHSQEAHRLMLDLRAALDRELRSLASQLQFVSIAAKSELQPDPGETNGSVRNSLLVIVGDPLAPIHLPDGFPEEDDKWRILPAFRSADKPTLSRALRMELQYLNVAFWDRSIEEAIPAVFAQSGLTTAIPRIFIRYRQRETAGLALQLFDALSHAGFDPFLDHFRIPPGVDFQSRLTQELGDESGRTGIGVSGDLDSEWKLYEINTARRRRLGLFSVHVPGGTRVPGIDDASRYFICSHHLAHPNENPKEFSLTTELNRPTRPWLNHLVRSIRIRTEHDRTLVLRRQSLRESLQGAILGQGIGDGDQFFDAAGALHIGGQ